MDREPAATMQPTPQDNQLMSKHRVLSFKPQLRLEWRGQDGQNETEQPDHSASLGDSVKSSTRTGFSVHTRGFSTCGRFPGFFSRSLKASTVCANAQRLASKFRYDIGTEVLPFGYRANLVE